MPTKNYFLTCIFFITLYTTRLSGQGCSDAGFCTISSFKPNSTSALKSFKTQLKSGAFSGKADHSIQVYGAYLELNRELSKGFGVDIKLTSLAQNGNGISVFGLSDIYLNTRYAVSEKVRLTGGLKIPLTAGNSTQQGLPLPMDYQASLGTVDLILGIGYQLNRWQFTAAIQQPVTQNKNQFLASSYPPASALSRIQSTNQFKRSGDIMLRVSYPVNLTPTLKLTPGLLPIFHLSADKYTDGLNVQRVITGSQGLTLNGNLYLDYAINRKNSIQLNAGKPFLVRDARPDGLTRSYIVNLEYSIRF